MARRTKAESVAEIERLLTIFETYSEFLARFAENGVASASGEGDDYLTPDYWRNWIEEGKATPAQCITQLTSMLKLARAEVLDWGQYRPAKKDDFLAFYADRHDGRDFFIEVANPDKDIASILKRGKIKNEAEWRLVNELLSNGSLDERLPQDSETLRGYLAGFEFGRPVDSEDSA